MNINDIETRKSKPQDTNLNVLEYVIIKVQIIRFLCGWVEVDILMYYW